jgi:hypothetical protein
VGSADACECEEGRSVGKVCGEDGSTHPENCRFNRRRALLFLLTAPPLVDLVKTVHTKNRMRKDVIQTYRSDFVVSNCVEAWCSGFIEAEVSLKGRGKSNRGAIGFQLYLLTAPPLIDLV